MGVMLFEFVCGALVRIHCLVGSPALWTSAARGYLPFADDLDDPTEVCTAVLKEGCPCMSGSARQHADTTVKDPLQFPSNYKDAPGTNSTKIALT